MNSLISEIVGQKGVNSFIKRMHEIKDVVKSSDIDQLITETNISQNIFSDLAKAGLFTETPDGFYISPLGKKVSLLLRALNDEEQISEVFQRLSHLYPSLKSSLVSEIVGQKGVYSFLNRMYEIKDVVKSSDIGQLITETNISQDIFSDLTKVGLFTETPDGFYISSLGEKVAILLRALNDEEQISEVFQKLSSLYPGLKKYELVKESITDDLIDSLYTNPDFIRVLICSPWIKLDESRLKKFQSAIVEASKRYKNIDIKIITLPKEGYSNWKASIETFKLFKNLGAEIMTHTKKKTKYLYMLHTKLYIVEPGPYGGAHYAIIGSENLTGSGNKELAIKIKNDSEILSKLNQYFFEMQQESEILSEVKL